MPAHSSSARKNTKGGMNSMPLRPRRKRVEQTPEMMRRDQHLIAEYLKTNAVTVCPPAYAMGSLKSTAFGLDV